jgi:hypothetical protein
VHPRRSEVGLPATLADLVLEALVLTAAELGELDPFGPGRGLGVEEHRQVEALGDAPPERASERDGLLHGRAGERHERDDIRGPDPWMLAVVLLHVDFVDRYGHRPLECLGDGV